MLWSAAYQPTMLGQATTPWFGRTNLVAEEQNRHRWGG